MVSCTQRSTLELGTDAYHRHYIPGGTPDIEAATVEKMMADHCPLGRCAVAEDVARVVAFLMSEDGGWVNGQIITISGGSSQ
jgi:3-oxoacyl-[acyl-carrier protein] reductase